MSNPGVVNNYNINVTKDDVKEFVEAMYNNINAISKMKAYIELEGECGESTYIQESIEEINNKLNSSETYIQIGNCIVKRSIVKYVVVVEEES